VAAVYSIVALTLIAASAHPVLARSLADVRFTNALTTTPTLTPAPALIVAPPVAQGVTPAQAPTKKPTDSLASKPVKKEVRTQAILKPAKDTAAAKQMKEFTLDQQAAIKPGATAPRYPEILKQAGITGTTLVMFVVDTSGNVDEQTLKVVRTAHPLFVEAVKASLPGLKFYPAQVGNRHVKQLVQMLYRFVTTGHPAPDSVQAVKDVKAFEVVITAVDQPRPGNVLEPPGIESALYVVDGKPTPRAVAMKIPADKIEKVEVLKGDAARAKYGEDGKNGVILITTKP